MSDGQRRMKSTEFLLFRPNASGLDVVSDIADGMDDLLRLHSAKELRALCNIVGLEPGGTNKQRVLRLFEEYLTDLSKYKDLLTVMWEHTLIAYLKSVGFAMRKGAEDPRKTIFRYWMELRKPDEPAFTGTLVPRTKRHPMYECTSDPMVVSFLEELKFHEARVKDGELRLRKHQTTESVIEFFNDIHSMREVEKRGRKYLINAFETAKAKQYHVAQTLALTRERSQTLQFIHEDMARQQFRKRGTENAALEMYFGMVGQAAVRNLDIKYKWTRAKSQLEDRLALFTRHRDITNRAASYSEMNCKMAKKNLEILLNNIASLEDQIKTRSAKFAELQSRYAQYSASDSVEADIYFDMASNSVYKAKDYSSMFNKVGAILVKKLRADKPNAKAETNVVAECAESMLLKLDIFDQDALREKKEHILMWKEEIAQRRVEAVIETKNKKGKKGKKGKKDGKKKAAKKKDKKKSKKKGKKGDKDKKGKGEGEGKRAKKK